MPFTCFDINLTINQVECIPKIPAVNTLMKLYGVYWQLLHQIVVVHDEAAMLIKVSDRTNN